MDLSKIANFALNGIKKLQDRDDTLVDQNAFVDGVRAGERDVVKPPLSSNNTRLDRVNRESEALVDSGIPSQPLPQRLERPPEPVVESLGGPAEEQLVKSRRVDTQQRIAELRAALFNAVEGSNNWRRLKQTIRNLEDRLARELQETPRSAPAPKPRKPIDIVNDLPGKIASKWVGKIVDLAKEPLQNFSQKYSLPWRPPSPRTAARRFWTMGNDPKDPRYADIKVKYFASDLLGMLRPEGKEAENGFLMTFPK